MIHTLKGPIERDNLGFTLIHEHLFCRVPDRFLQDALDYLEYQLSLLSERGVGTIVDVTPYVLPDRFFDVLVKHAVNVVCCAGYYLPRFVPSGFRNQSVQQLTDALARKIENGIGRYKILPGILKGASAGRTIRPDEKRYIQALGAAQCKYGLPLQMHSCRGGRSQLELLISSGADPARVVLSHMEQEMKGISPSSPQTLLTDVKWVLAQGAYLFIGDFSVHDSPYRRNIVWLIERIVELGYSSRLLFSTDSHWSVRRKGLTLRGCPAHRTHERSYNYVFTTIVPLLLETGFTATNLNQFFHENPARLFAK